MTLSHNDIDPTPDEKAFHSREFWSETRIKDKKDRDDLWMKRFRLYFPYMASNLDHIWFENDSDPAPRYCYIFLKNNNVYKFEVSYTQRTAAMLTKIKGKAEHDVD